MSVLSKIIYEREKGAAHHRYLMSHKYIITIAEVMLAILITTTFFLFHDTIIKFFSRIITL